MEDVVPAAKRQCMQPAAGGVISGASEVIVLDSDDDAQRAETDDLPQLNGLSDSQPRCSTPLPEDREEDEVLSSCGINNESVASFIDDVNGEDPVNHDELDQQVLNDLDQSFQSFIDEAEEEEMEGVPVSNGGAKNGAAANEALSMMECLPSEVLEDVFVWVPLIELFASCRLVSRRWNEVISREKFLYWKKSYYQVKADCLPVVANVDSLILTHQLMPATGSHQTIPPNVTILRLARFVSDAFNHLDVDLTKMEEILKKHPQYSCVQQISQLQKMKGKENLSAMESLVLLVTCSTSVHQVLHLVLLLNTPQNGGLSPPILTHTQLTEIMFCLATFFYSLWIKKVLPPRFHYYVYYAMNVLERSSPSALLLFSSHDISAAVSVRQPLSPPVPLTSEQMMIVNHPYREGETVKVVAFAGTGKTATLVELARKLPDKKFLFCVYNKSVQQYAENQVFGKCSNVTCRTFHSLAYKMSYKPKLINSLKPNNIARWLSSARKHHLAETVLCTLNTFFASADTEICEKHVSEEMFGTQVINHSIPKSDVVRETRQIWERMKNLEDKEAKISHDAYLKMFQLRDEVIKGYGEHYDMILVDEAQDLTPAIVAILRRQPHAMIYVGDPHQSIYRFRGAVNAIASVHADHTYSLTRSFRFGPEIAYVGSLLLSVLKQVKSRTLVGGLQTGSIYGDKTGQVAIIARTNLTLFDEMVNVIQSTDLSSKKLGFTGGIQSYDFNVILDILKLKKGIPPSNLTSFVKYFKSYQALKTYADKAWHDPSLLMKINICEKYGDRLPDLIERIRKRNCGKLTDADIVFSTAHKSKGLEFETVVVANDFLLRLDPANLSLFDLYETNEDERNLLYVAATRAKRHLVMSTMLHQLLQEAKEPFTFPTGCGGASQQGQVQCASCEMLHRLPELRLNIRKFTLNDGKVIAGGTICKFCGADRFPALLYHATQDES